MNKVYAIYNIKKKCLEHLRKVKLNAENKHVIFKLDNVKGEIWTTRSAEIAEMVKNKTIHKILESSEEMPFNPYKSQDLMVVELDSVEKNKMPLPSLKSFIKLKEPTPELLAV